MIGVSMRVTPYAESYEQGQKKGREVIAHYRQRLPSAMKCMEETLDACLQALRLPPAHHKRLRTSNLLERTFGEHKRRTKVIPHFFTDSASPSSWRLRTNGAASGSSAISTAGCIS